MSNPFHLQEIPVDAPFCDREEELGELYSYAEGGANVVLYSPRRYGKTSLVRRVQKELSEGGAVTVFADLFGVASIDDAAARLARAVFAVTHGREPFWRSALATIRSFRPVLKPDPVGGISLSVEPSSEGRSGIALLEETMEGLGRFIEANGLVHIALDEFQEIVTLKEACRIEATMRTHIHRHSASYFFIGSRRRVLLGIFNEAQRPFFQSALNYPLKRLPPEELTAFVARQFNENGRRCTAAPARALCTRTANHPYYTQKLAFLVYGLCQEVTEEAIRLGFEKLILTDKVVFEAVLSGLPPHQRLLLTTLAVEPTGKILASDYIRRHRLGSIGGIQHSTRRLEELDLIEKDEGTGRWRLVDPILEMWLKRRREERVQVREDTPALDNG